MMRHRNWTRITRLFIYAITVVPFTIVYALTVSPFTVQFFRTIASSPDVGGVTLLGIWPLRQVHEFFLPLFVFYLEAISIQLSAAVWTLGLSRRFRMMAPVLAILVAAQLFPTFSVYLDARGTEFQNNNATHYDPSDQRKAAEVKVRNQKRKDAYAEAKLIYDKNVKTWSDSADAQIRDLEGQLALVDASIANLQQTIPTVPANAQLTDLENQLKANESSIQKLQEQPVDTWPEKTKIEFNRLMAQRKDISDQINSTQAVRQRQAAEQTKAESDRLSQARKELNDKMDAVRADLQRRISDPALAPKQEPLEDELEPVPKYNDVVQFTVGTWWWTEALFSLFVSLIFPIIVLAAGYVIARYGGGQVQSETALQTSLPYFRLSDHLKLGSGLSETRQNDYADDILQSLAIYATTIRANRQGLALKTGLHLDLDLAIDEVQMLDAAKQEIEQSGLSRSIKDWLMASIDKLIVGDAFAKPASQPGAPSGEKAEAPTPGSPNGAKEKAGTS